jgi:hypothetical protein
MYYECRLLGCNIPEDGIVQFQHYHIGRKAQGLLPVEVTGFFN